MVLRVGPTIAQGLCRHQILLRQRVGDVSLQRVWLRQRYEPIGELIVELDQLVVCRILGTLVNHSLVVRNLHGRTAAYERVNHICDGLGVWAGLLKRQGQMRVTHYDFELAGSICVALQLQEAVGQFEVAVLDLELLERVEQVFESENDAP
jgi:hypothetical protein